MSELDSARTKADREAPMMPWPTNGDLVSAIADYARAHGPVFRLPAFRPTYVLAGEEGVRTLDDLALVERTVIAIPPDAHLQLANDAIGPLSSVDGDEHFRRLSAWVTPGGLDRTGLEECMPRLHRAVDAILNGWAQLGMFSLSLEVQRATWRIATMLMLGRETEGQRLVDVDIRAKGAEPADREAAKSRLLEWLDREAEALERGRGASTCIGAKLAASGKLSRAELVNEINRGLTASMFGCVSTTEILHRLCRDRALLAEVRDENRGLANDFSVASMRRTPQLLALIDESLRITTPVPLLYARAKADFQVAGVTVPAGAVLLCAAHATNQDTSFEPTTRPDHLARPAGNLAFGTGRHLCPASNVATVSMWLLATKVLGAYDLRALDPSDVPVRHPSGWFAPRGAYVRFARGALDVRTPIKRQPSIPPPRGMTRLSTTSPMTLDTRIAVVGAGISGLTVAHELRKRGFRHVTVFERAPSVGGKADTVSIDGRPYNLGAHLCHASLGVAALAEDVGVPMERTTSYVLWDIDENKAAPRRYQDMAEFDKFRRLLAERPELASVPGFAAAEEETYPAVDRWLSAHDLGALREVGPFFTGAGYGFMNEDIPAGFFLKFAQHMTADGWTPGGGYKHLLESVSHGLDVRCSTEVVRVRRTAMEGIFMDTAPVVSSIKEGDPTFERGELQHHVFDRLILTGPLEHSERYLDQTAEERELFGRIKSDSYCTVLATLKIEAPHAPGLYIVPTNTASRGEGGRTTAFVRLYEESKVYHFFFYAEPGQSEASIMERLRDDARKLGGEIADVHVFRKWAYGPRVSPHDMALGYHRRFQRLQGKDCTYYAGSLLAFELTDHNVLFAKSLVDRFFSAASVEDDRGRSLPPAARSLPPPGVTAPTVADDDGEVDFLCRVPERGTQSILEILRERYEQTPDKVLCQLLDAKGKEVRALTYRILVDRAMACAIALGDAGVKAGDRVALVYPPDTDEFLVGFFGCSFAGAIAVPVASPDPRTLETEIPKFAHVVNDCECRVALTTRLYHAAVFVGRAWQRLKSVGGTGGAKWPKLTWIRTDGLSPIAPNTRMPIPSPTASTTAYLQYTSGSTSAPKGVMINHGNILHNLEAIRRQANMTPHSVLVGWVPLFHNMGLIGGPLNTLYSGAHLVFFSPLGFLHNPRLWVESMHKYRATHTVSPNFGYEFLLRGIEGDLLEGIDLSCVTHALMGGEAMRHRTFERISERLQRTGFRPEAMLNIYGATEATLFMAGGGDGATPLLSVSTHALQAARRAVPSPPDAFSTTVLIGSRLATDACDVRIVEADTTRLLPDRDVGEIWLSSPSVVDGYWAREREENDRTFRARIAGDPSPLRTYMRTGDLGFIERGVLYICGRLKEMMIFEGRNIYPTDVEAAVLSAHPAIRPSGAAAFSVEEAEQERLVIVAEIESTAASSASAAASAIAVAVANQHQLSCRAVVLVPSGSLPRTSGGKLQRYRVREAYEARMLHVLYEQSSDAGVSAARVSAEATSAKDEAQEPTFTGDPTSTERWLQRLVASTLNVPPDEVSTSISLAMFGIGSAQALSMVVKISEYVGRELSPSILFEHQTIDALVSYLCGSEKLEKRILVPLQRGDRERSRTLFCVHPVGGSAMAYQGLVKHLPEQVPVYAFDSDGSEVPCDDLVVMARRYVEEMRAVQPDGPYHLVGYSFGGTVAFEMARQLRAAGLEVGNLFMIDSPAPLYLDAQGGPETAETETYARFLESAMLNRIISDELDDVARNKLRERVEQNHRAHARYRVEPDASGFPDITFFRAADEAPNLRAHLRHPAFDLPDFGWKQVSAGAIVDVTMVPGDHFSVMREPAALAAMLATAI